jgi:putative ubiquitin-RnfH superfamily antitoxin RatB of RatAB toxin-antitoxin module
LNDDLVIELLLAMPNEIFVQKIYISNGTTVGEIKKRGDIKDIFVDALKITDSIAINGKKVPDEYKIYENERLIVLRHLILDPKEMRRRGSIKL